MQTISLSLVSWPIINSPILIVQSRAFYIFPTYNLQISSVHSLLWSLPSVFAEKSAAATPRPVFFGSFKLRPGQNCCLHKLWPPPNFCTNCKFLCVKHKFWTYLLLKMHTSFEHICAQLAFWGEVLYMLPISHRHESASKETKLDHDWHDYLQGGHFFGVELYTGHLYLHLNLGTGHIKIRVSHRLDDKHLITNVQIMDIMCSDHSHDDDDDDDQNDAQEN